MSADDDPKDPPKPGWGSLVGALGRDLAKLGGGLQRAIRDASDSEAAKQLKGALADVGPQMKKAAQSLGPELQKVVDQVRPDVERAVSQLRPEVERIVGEAKPVIEGALGELLRREPKPPSDTSASPPNVCPDVQLDQDEDETRPDATSPSSPAVDIDTPVPAPAKTLGRKTQRKGGKGPATS